MIFLHIGDALFKYKYDKINMIDMKQDVKKRIYV